MSLHRTPSGLANLHLFFRVERVIYCEGGISLTEQQVVDGGGDTETLDVCFWQSIFRIFGSNSSAHFKSIGSKQTLRTLAQTVEAHNIANVLICLDSDHDSALGKKIQAPHVLYTWGYSWENDVLSDDTLESLFFRFRNRNPDAIADYANAERTFEEFLQKIRKFAACDVYFIAKALGGMFRRDAPPSAIAIQKNVPPDLNEDFLRRRLRELGYTRIPTTKYRIEPSQVKHRLFGKMLGRFVYHLISFFSSPGRNSPFVSYEMFMRAAIMRFEETLEAGGLPNVRAHFGGVVP